MKRRLRHDWNSKAAPRHCTRCGVKQHLRERATKRSRRGVTRELWMAWPSGASKRTDDVGTCIKPPVVRYARRSPSTMPTNPWVQKAIDLIRSTGCTATHAAGLYGVDPAGVARQARKAGVAVRRPGRPKKETS
jgi:hypothetical protein